MEGYGSGKARMEKERRELNKEGRKKEVRTFPITLVDRHPCW